MPLKEATVGSKIKSSTSQTFSAKKFNTVQAIKVVEHDRSCAFLQHLLKDCLDQGTLTEGEDLVQLTSKLR